MMLYVRDIQQTFIKIKTFRINKKRIVVKTLGEQELIHGEVGGCNFKFSPEPFMWYKIKNPWTNHSYYEVFFLFHTNLTHQGLHFPILLLNKFQRDLTSWKIWLKVKFLMGLQLVESILTLNALLNVSPKQIVNWTYLPFCKKCVLQNF